MTDLIDTVQLQEIDDALIELFDITLPDGTTKIYLHNGLDQGDENIYFPNKAGNTLNEYISMPISISGVETSSSGAQARPTLSMANIPVLARTISNDGDGAEDEELLQDIFADNGFTSNEDFLNTRVEYRRTLFKHTYKVADVSGWTTTSPIEFPSVIYIVDRVSSEDNIFVQFELASPIDIEGVTLPNRVIIGKYCSWKYQGRNLNYEGGCTWDLDSRGRFFDKNDEIITKDISTINEWNSSSTYTLNTNDSPPIRVKTTSNNHTQIWRALRNVPANKSPLSNGFYWYREDVCGKLINSCKVRFQGNNNDTTLNTSQTLPFGGFPGARTYR